MKLEPDKTEKSRNNRRQQRKKDIFIGIFILILLLFGFVYFQRHPLPALTDQPITLSYSEFKDKIKAGQIIEATIGTTRITGEMEKTTAGPNEASTQSFVTAMIPTGDPNLVAELESANVKYSAQLTPYPTSQYVLSWIMPVAFIAGAWFILSRRKPSGARGKIKNMLDANQSKATQVESNDLGTTFKDVGGADEAIVELQEIIDFLKYPERFAHLGGRIPKGVLLVGPPGTGKTLLAKATAGEAHVSFFESSGAEFVEMFVGVGAARVRDLFERARKGAPAIVFIDEIDAIGQSRTGSINLGGNDEREQTLNQLLAEIDGFKTDSNAPVIIMAATNRPDVLDAALLRAGRFDRQIVVGQPDLAGRLQILRIHSQNVRLSPDFDLERAARITPGFSGADLANLLNEAVLLAARRGADVVTMQEFEAAIERVVAGLERKSRLMNEKERKTVAFHESGHALVAAMTPHADPIAKISIIPRGPGALGYVLQMPTEDRYLLSKEELEDRIAVMMGGRAAEEVVLGSISTGASDDIQKATELARRMVTEFGMSEKLGPLRYAAQQLQYLPGASQESSAMSSQKRAEIDDEITRIVTEQHQRVCNLLRQHRDSLDILANTLLERETIDGSLVNEILGLDKI
jgi:cell division protease FtsH